MKPTHATLIFAVFALAWAGPLRADSIRRVDYSDAPDAASLADHARQVGNAVYPEITRLLADDHFQPPRRLDIVFRRHLDYGLSGAAFRDAVMLDASLLQDYPDLLDFVLVHEMAHVVQAYPSLPYRRSWQWYGHCLGFELTHLRRYPAFPPSFWVEGIANSVAYRLGYTTDLDCAECAERFPNYTDGYGCAAALLSYIDNRTGTDFTLKLNSALRAGSYSAAFFKKETGKSLDDWWKGLQQTSAFQPIAADYNALDEAMEHGPEKTSALRLDSYLKSHPDVRDFLGQFSVFDKMDPASVQQAIKTYFYNREQPGEEDKLQLAQALQCDFQETLNQTDAASLFAPHRAARLQAYLLQHPEIKDWCAAHQWLAKPGDDVEHEIENFFLINLRPNSDLLVSAYEWLARLKSQGQLPGWRAAEPVEATLGPKTLARRSPAPAGDDRFPFSLMFDCQKPGGKTTCHYRLSKASSSSAWQLKDFWATDPRGRVIEINLLGRTAPRRSL